MFKNQRVFGLIVFLFLVSLETCSGQEKKYLKMIFELPNEDDLTVDKKTIVEHCSKVLAAREKESEKTIAKALKSRGLAYVNMGELKAAKKDFDDLCALRPKSSEARCLRAAVVSGLQLLEEAMEDTKEALRLDAKNPVAHLSMAANLFESGDLKGSLESLDRAITLRAYPNNP